MVTATVQLITREIAAIPARMYLLRTRNWDWMWKRHGQLRGSANADHATVRMRVRAIAATPAMIYWPPIKRRDGTGQILCSRRSSACRGEEEEEEDEKEEEEEEEEEEEVEQEQKQEQEEEHEKTEEEKVTQNMRSRDVSG